MEAKISATLGLPCPSTNRYSSHQNLFDFDHFSNHFNFLLSIPNLPSVNPSQCYNQNKNRCKNNSVTFSSTTISVNSSLQSPSPDQNPDSGNLKKPKSRSGNWLKPASRGSPKVQSLMKSISVLEKSVIGSLAGGIAGAFTYVCLLPLDTIKTKLQAKGASEIYRGTIDVITKTFQTKGILGFYSGISAVIIGSTASSAVYFGTCEFGKSVLSKIPNYPSFMIPPTAGAMGNIVSSAIMVPKELITQRMQTGASGRSWQVLLRILQTDGILGLYAGYTATLLRNLPSGVLSYSSFEYLKAVVLSKTKKNHLDPVQSVCCGALAGAISATLTTPLDVVKTRLMTQIHGGKQGEITRSVYGGITETIKQILKEEGWIGLTRGIGPRISHSVCFAALGYFAFETARLTLLNHYLTRKNEEEDIHHD